MANFKLAAFDLDGTLFDNTHRVSDKTITVLRRVAAQGIHLVAATGRGHASAGPLLATTRAIEWAVCSNGASIYNVAQNKVTDRREIPSQLVEPIINRIRSNFEGVVFGWETFDQHFWSEGFVAIVGSHLQDQPSVDDLALPQHEILKLYIGHPEISNSDMLLELTKLDLGVEVAASGTRFLEVTGPQINKATGLNIMCDRLGVQPQEVVAFGDNNNDLPMLKWAGRGYAMANAHHQVVAATNYRTRFSNSAEGVADTLTELFLG